MPVEENVSTLGTLVLPKGHFVEQGSGSHYKRACEDKGLDLHLRRGTGQMFLQRSVSGRTWIS